MPMSFLSVDLDAIHQGGTAMFDSHDGDLLGWLADAVGWAREHRPWPLELSKWVRLLVTLIGQAVDRRRRPGNASPARKEDDGR
jgi:hypothetical protein